MTTRTKSLALLALAAVLAGGCGKKDAQTVAEFDGKKISAGELLIQYSKISPPNRPLFSSLEQKKAFLDVVILKEILKSEAIARGLDKNPDVLAGVQTFEDTQLLKDLYAEKGQKAVVVDPTELEAYYKTTNEQVRLRNIWFDKDKATADATLKAIREGADFAEMARKHSKNEYAANGGDMGLNPRSSMLYALFGDALDAMKPGDISDLIETPAGYYLVQVAEVQPADMTEYEAKKMATRADFRRKMENKEWQRYIEGLRKQSNPTLVPENFRIAQDRARQTVAGEVPSFNDAEKALPLITSGSGDWTVGDFVTYMNSTGPAFRPNIADTTVDWGGWMTNRAMSKLLLKTARESGLDKGSDFVERTGRKREELMLDQLHAEIVKGVDVTEDEQRAQYEARKDSLRGPEMANVRFIVTSAQARIDSAAAELEAGKPFTQVAKRFSEDPGVKTNGGRADSLAKGAMGLPEIDEAIFALAPGERTKALTGQQRFFIFEMIEKWPGRQLPFEEVSRDIAAEIRARKEGKAFDDWIAQKKQGMTIKVNDDALKAIIAEEGGDA
jgi:parvulin-like peptidyl-prolyl isomerase